MYQFVAENNPKQIHGKIYIFRKKEVAWGQVLQSKKDE